MPEWSRCCAANAEYIKRYCGKEVELIGVPLETDYSCKFCGFQKIVMTYLSLKGIGGGALYLCTEFIDIAED